MLGITLAATALFTMGYAGTAAGESTASHHVQQTLPPEEFYSDFNTAIQITNQYWATHFSEHVQGSYVPPQLVNTRPDLGLGFYDAIGTTDSRTVSPAGDLVLCKDFYLWDNNAFYCGPPYSPNDDYIAFDYSFMSQAHTYGDMFIYFIVAHEWAHSIQARAADSARWVQAELQADCIAGGTIRGMSADGTIVLEPGDSDELGNILTALADQYEWTKVGDHGSPAQRIAAYNQGAVNGVNSCWNFG